MADTIIEQAHEFLRSHLSGRIRFDGDAVALRIVIAPDGRLVASVMVAMIRALETVLEIPDDADENLHLMVTLEAFEESGAHGALADRWRIYHGDPPDVRWGIMTIDAARFQGHFIDGEALQRPNRLAAIEPSILRQINQGDRALLRRACVAANLESEQPIAVGVDERGIDVRRAFDVVRLRFPEPLSVEDSALLAADGSTALRAVEQALSPS